jgi:hypothetical protein
MQLLHSPDDPLLEETLRYIIQNVLESPGSNYRVQSGKVTLGCTANTLKTQAVTFDKPFAAIPILIPGKNPSIVSSVATESYSSLTATGFTAQMYTSSNQNVDFTYLAIGPV